MTGQWHAPRARRNARALAPRGRNIARLENGGDQSMRRALRGEKQHEMAKAMWRKWHQHGEK